MSKNIGKIRTKYLEGITKQLLASVAPDTWIESVHAGHPEWVIVAVTSYAGSARCLHFPRDLLERYGRYGLSSQLREDLLRDPAFRWIVDEAEQFG